MFVHNSILSSYDENSPWKLSRAALNNSILSLRALSVQMQGASRRPRLVVLGEVCNAAGVRSGHALWGFQASQRQHTVIQSCPNYLSE
jgi:hypothetical protein